MVYILSSLIKRKAKTFYQKKKRYRWKSAQIRYSVMQIMTREKNNSTNALRPRHLILNSVIFPQILYDNVLYARHFLPVKFFPSITFINYVSSYCKM